MLGDILASNASNFFSESYALTVFICIDVILAFIIMVVAYRWVFKYVFDFLVGFLISLVTLPVWLTVAIISKVHIIRKNEYASIFTYRYVAGKKGKPVKIYSFTVLNSLSGELTKLGKFLRKTRIEKLPAVFSLLSLRISIVGVSPLSLIDEKFISEEDYVRFSVRPGFISPLSSMSESAQTFTYEDMFALDKRYVEKYGFFGDLRILLMPFINKIRGEKKDVFGEISQKTYAQVLLERGEITDEDYAEACEEIEEYEREEEPSDGTDDVEDAEGDQVDEEIEE